MSVHDEAREIDRAWVLDVAWDGVAGVAFLAVGIIILGHLRGLDRRSVSGLAGATVFILFVKGVGHFIHAGLLLWSMPGDGAVTRAARIYASHWDIWILDAVAALAALAYLVLRSRLVSKGAGVGLYDDLEQRQARAMNLHDQVVQQIVRARWSLELDAVDSRAAIAAATEAIDGILDHLAEHLEEEGVIAPG